VKDLLNSACSKPHLATALATALARELIFSFAKRELVGRYKGSALGIAWAVLTPVVMIAIFTFIFAGIFGARFGANNSHWDYALYLFCGLLPWTMFQESVQQSANTILAPCESRQASRVPARDIAGGAGARGARQSTVRHCRSADRNDHRSATARPHRVVAAGVVDSAVFFALGAAWLIASLGVFLRDITQGLTLLLMAWMYLTPIIYPESIVPERLRPFINFNPFTPLVRSYRRIFLDGSAPDWRGSPTSPPSRLRVWSFRLRLLVVRAHPQELRRRSDSRGIVCRT
jgi:lipopolysaccharide transport system permease protein